MLLPNKLKNAICILGMHRSGTSWMTSLLVLGGANRPKDVLSAKAKNAKGYESKAVNRINEKILEQSGGAWFNLPELIKIPRKPSIRTIRFLFQHRNTPMLVVKDPRMVHTYEYWEPYLEKPEIVICFRRPESVAKSLKTRDGDMLSQDEAMKLWNAYNLKLLERVDDFNNACWVNFDDIEGSLPALTTLFERSGLTDLQGAMAATYSTDRRRHSVDASDVAPQCAETYQKLVERWQRNQNK